MSVRRVYACCLLWCLTPLKMHMLSADVRAAHFKHNACRRTAQIGCLNLVWLVWSVQCAPRTNIFAPDESVAFSISNPCTNGAGLLLNLHTMLLHMS